MTKSPYSTFTSEQLILRDFLAADRTVLANERTLLAYIRTSLALLAAGVSLLHFFDELVADVLGLLCIPAGVAILLVGIWRFHQMKLIVDGIAREALNAPQER